MKNNSHARRLEHRANMRKVTAGELTGAEAEAVKAAEKARREVKPAPVLTRKQRKGKKALKRTTK